MPIRTSQKEVWKRKGDACEHLKPRRPSPSSVGLFGKVCEATTGKKRITFGKGRDNDPVKALLADGAPSRASAMGAVKFAEY